MTRNIADVQREARQGFEALEFFHRARLVGVLHWDRGVSFDVLARLDAMTYVVVLTCYERRQDGTIGRRPAPPVFFKGASMVGALVDAAGWLRSEYPELEKEKPDDA